jgi:sec-independent protein translocase protein TatB
MFDIGWSELMVIAVVALVVIGPKDLPRAMRIVGKWTGRMKKMAREFQGQFNEALREAELEDVKKGVEAIGKIDPMAGVRKELASVEASVRNLDKPAPPVAAPAPATVSEPAIPATPATPAEPVAAAAASAAKAEP